MNKTYYLIYKITNVINNKFYIGAHKTTNINDNYMGSGHALSRAIKKYGLYNFTKDILFIFDTEQDMWNKESELVNEDFCKREDTYNIKTGGIGGWGYCHRHWNGSVAQREYFRLYGEINGKRLNNFIHEQKTSNSIWWQKRYDNIVSTNRSKNSNSWINLTDGEIAARRNELSRTSSGSNNSQFGRYWISNVLTKEVKRINSDEEIPEGWVRGKSGKLYTKCWVNNGTTEFRIPREEEDKYIANGFIKGRLKTSMPSKN